MFLWWNQEKWGFPWDLSMQNVDFMVIQWGFHWISCELNMKNGISWVLTEKNGRSNGIFTN